MLGDASAPQVQFAHLADLIGLDKRRNRWMTVIFGRPLVRQEFQSVAGERFCAADGAGLKIRADAKPMPAHTGLESAGQHIRLALTVKIDGLFVVGIPHLQGGRIELHASVRRIGALEYRAGEHIALELACRHLVRRDSASRDLHGRHTVCRQLVGGDGTSHNLGRIDRISSQFVGIHDTNRQGSSGHGISRNLSGLNLVDVEQRHGHIFRDLELRRRDRVGCNLVGRDGQCDYIPRLHRVGGEFRGGHRISHQLFSRDRIGRELVHRDGIGLDLLGGH